MEYIYKHTNKKGEIFYIGKGTFQPSDVVKNGYSRAFSKDKRTLEWIEKAKDGYDVDIVLKSKDSEFIKSEEIRLINACLTCINVQKTPNKVDYTISLIDNTKATLNIYNKNYIITAEGQILTDRKGQLREKVNSISNSGYKQATFSNGRKITKALLVHRLVAEAFLPNPNNYKVVHHKDGNRLNCHKNNLEWCTTQKNYSYCVKSGNAAYQQKMINIYQFNKEGVFVKKWTGLRELCNILFNNNQERLSNLWAVCSENNRSILLNDYFWIKEELLINNKLDKYVKRASGEIKTTKSLKMAIEKLLITLKTFNI